MTEGGRGRQGAWRLIVALAILVAASLLVLHLVERPRPGRSARGSRPPPSRHHPPPPGPAGPAAPPGPDLPEEDDWVVSGGGPARVALVIDDVGFDPAPALALAGLGLSLTFAILPHQAHTRDLAARLSASGYEVILHMPMEPRGFPARDPGEGAVSLGMSPGEAGAAVRSALDEIPQARGLNNHMGSRITSDPAAMRAVLEVVRERGLYFLDSRTTRDTVGFEMAREMGIPALERSVFLDDRREASYIESQVRSLLRRAREEGSAVGIGHADRTTVEVLKRSVGLFREEGIRVVPASELASRGDGKSG